jgi:hypothetical protein
MGAHKASWAWAWAWAWAWECAWCQKTVLCNTHTHMYTHVHNDTKKKKKKKRVVRNFQASSFNGLLLSIVLDLWNGRVAARSESFPLPWTPSVFPSQNLLG